MSTNVSGGNNNKNNINNKKRKSKKKKKSSQVAVGIVCATVLGVMVVLIGGGYFVGRTYYKDKFLAGTKINNVDVGGKTLKEAYKVFETDTSTKSLKVITIDGDAYTFKFDDFDYDTNDEEEIAKLFKKNEPAKWFTGYAKETNFNFTATATFDKDKLAKLLRDNNWGENPTTNAKIVYKNDDCSIQKEVQGDEVTDIDKLVSYVQTQFAKGSDTVTLNADTGCYTLPSVKSDDLTDSYQKALSLYKMSITYDFDYATETLKDDKLADMVTINEDGSITADRDKAMKYVEALAKKYDTYNTKRKFHATKQGDIIIPTSDDAKYGWWIDQERTCDELVAMLESGETVDSVDPIYYEDGSYVYTGYEPARTADDDIGDTYIEVDLSAQYLWYYKDGKVKYESNIVSGQTTSLTRTTLPGCYKLWFKAANYRMKDTNADGDSWDTTCNYWNQIAIVGIGLHDSTWRYGFGGDIYTYLGSHGCINMPYDTAEYVYNNVEIGTPVIMYYKSADSDASTPYDL